MTVKSEENLDTCEEKQMALIAKTNSAVVAAASAQLEEGGCFNKDAKMLQFPASKLAMRIEKRVAKNGNCYHKLCVQ